MKIIFFGNGPLADYSLSVLRQHFEVIFHARTKDDLAVVKKLKAENPDAFGILASFGVMIKADVLDLFEPTGILNLHPSLLPKYRGASPIESAILNGDDAFGYSIMKLVKAMDAGPVFHQAIVPNLPLEKSALYQGLATAGAEWLAQNLANLPEPTAQVGTPTFTAKFDKTMSFLRPEAHSAAEILRQIIAFQGFPKPKAEFYGKTCIILAAHLASTSETEALQAQAQSAAKPHMLALKCADGNFVIIDRLQPEGKNPMDAASFLNGYAKNA